jgi:hypothetical protein
MKNLIFCFAALLTVSVNAETPSKIDVSKLPQQSQLVDDVVVPVPSEIFAVLDKLGKPHWSEVLRPMDKVAAPFGTQPQIALYLGNVIAEGFIAVEAEDSEQVKKIGQSVLSLSKALGVQKSVMERANAIIEAGDKKDWPQVRRELEGALRKVKEAMNELQSGELAELVSLGGWLRGTEALTAVVGKHYTKDGAELLHQHVLLEYFSRRIEGLKSRFQKHPLIVKVQQGLTDIRPLIGLTDDAEISEKSVKEIGNITGSLVKAIQTK